LTVLDVEFWRGRRKSARQLIGARISVIAGPTACRSLEGVCAILVEPQLNPRVAQTTATEFSAGTVVVDPVGDPARSSYES